MGSCCSRHSQTASKQLLPDITEHTSRKNRQPTIVKLRKELETRRLIYLHKDLNTPQLCIKESDLYNRRHQKMSDELEC